MGALVAGANAKISGDVVSIKIELGQPADVGFAIIPRGNVLDAHLFPSDIATPSWLSSNENVFSVDLASIKEQEQKFMLVIYSALGVHGLRQAKSVSVELGGYSIYLDHSEMKGAAVIFAELYLRDGAWKVRALKEHVFDGIVELGSRYGKTIGQPSVMTAPPSPVQNDYQQPVERAEWAGSSLVVASNYAVTNAHVVDGAKDIYICGTQGRIKAEIVLMDKENDLAIVRLEKNVDKHKTGFRVSGLRLGEDVVAIGYPLSNYLSSSAQMSSGSIASLLGPSNDTRVLQTTCPVQPGSSGGPLFDIYGNIIGIMTASLLGSQNVNFAVRSSLVVALIESVNIPVSIGDEFSVVDLPTMVSKNADYVWRVECSK